MVMVLALLGAATGGFLLGLVLGLWAEAVAIHRAERELCLPLREADDEDPLAIAAADLAAAWAAARPPRTPPAATKTNDGPTINGAPR